MKLCLLKYLNCYIGLSEDLSLLVNVLHIGVTFLGVLQIVGNYKNRKSFLLSCVTL